MLTMNDEQASAPGLSTILGLLGIVVQDLTTDVGLNCSPITVIGVGQSECSANAVCCQDNSHVSPAAPSPSALLASASDSHLDLGFFRAASSRLDASQSSSEHGVPPAVLIMKHSEDDSESVCLRTIVDSSYHLLPCIRVVDCAK